MSQKLTLEQRDLDKVTRGMERRLLHLATALQRQLDSQEMCNSDKVTVSREEIETWADRVDSISEGLDNLNTLLAR